MSNHFIAEIQPFAFNFAPAGWATCDGQILSARQYTAVFAVINNLYGGNGPNTFALPNLAGRVAAGVQHDSGGFEVQLQHPIGQDFVTLTTANMAPHKHTLSVATGTFTQLGGTSPTQPSSNSAPSHPWAKATKQFEAYKTNGATAGTMASIAMSTVGGNMAHENRMPFVAANFCFALEGIFPTRP